MHRFPKKIAQGSLKPELIDLKQGLHPGLPGIRIGGAIDFQPLPAHVDSVGDPYVKLREFDTALETSGKCFDEPGAQNGFGAQDSDLDAHSEYGENSEDNAKNPPQATRTAGARLARLRHLGGRGDSLVLFGQA